MPFTFNSPIKVDSSGDKTHLRPRKLDLDSADGDNNGGSNPAGGDDNGGSNPAGRDKDEEENPEKPKKKRFRPTPVLLVKLGSNLGGQISNAITKISSRVHFAVCLSMTFVKVCTASASSLAFWRAGTCSSTQKVTSSMMPLCSACMVSTGVAPNVPRTGLAMGT
jgi:hypothetical protein